MENMVEYEITDEFKNIVDTKKIFENIKKEW